jgi:hypothetical protein
VCAAVRAVVEAAREDFVPLRCEPQPDPVNPALVRWAAQIQIPAKVPACVITYLPGAIDPPLYACGMDFGIDDPREVDSDYARLVGQLRRCLPDWAVATDDDPAASSSTRLLAPEHDVTLRVAYRRIPLSYRLEVQRVAARTGEPSPAP